MAAVNLLPLPFPKDLRPDRMLANMGTTWENFKKIKNHFPQFNVMDFGALPIPGFNSTTAIQKATNAAYAAGGGTVYYPPGSYLQTTITLNWTSSITVDFVGAGMHRTKIEKFDSSTTPFFDFSADSSILSVYSSIGKMWLSGSTTLYNCPGIRLTQIAYMKVYEVEFNYCSVGVDMLGALINNFYDCKFHLNVIGVKTRKAPSNNIYCNANNFFGCRWTGNRFQAVDYGQGSEVRFFGGDCENNGTEQKTFTVDTTTNLVTLSDSVVIPSGVAVWLASTTTLPVGTMPTSTFTADSTTDRIALVTDLGLPTGYPCTVSSTLTLPTGLSAATTYYLILVSAGVYKLATSRANALLHSGIDLTTNGTGTMTLSPSGVVAENDLWWSRVSGTTGYICSSYANAIAGTSIDFTSTPVGVYTISFVGTGGFLFRSSMDDETAGGGAADVRDPGIAHANIAGMHFEGNAGRGIATENSRGLVLSIRDSVSINNQQSNGGRSIFALGAKKLVVDSVSCGGAGDNVELRYGCNMTDVRNYAFSNFTELSPYPTHYNGIDSGGASFPGNSAHVHVWKDKQTYYHLGTSDDAHSVGNGAGDRLTFAASNSGGHKFTGGNLENAVFDAFDQPGRTAGINLVSASDAGTILKIENTTAIQEWLLAVGVDPTSSPAFPVAGSLFFRDGTGSVIHMELTRGGTLSLKTGDLRLETVGKGLHIKEGANSTMGRSVLVAGTVTVTNTKVTANSEIFLTRRVAGGTLGHLSIGTVTGATSFVINSSDAADTSTINWLIIEPA